MNLSKRHVVGDERPHIVGELDKVRVEDRSLLVVGLDLLNLVELFLAVSGAAIMRSPCCVLLP